MNLKEMHEAKQKKQQEQNLNAEDKKQLQECIEALEIAQAEREAEWNRAEMLLDEVREQESQLKEQNLTISKLKSKQAEADSLKDLVNELERELKQVNNAEKILNDLNEKKKQNEETKKELEQRKIQSSKREKLLNMKGIELSIRERAVSDIEQAVKRKAETERDREIEEHKRVMQEAEQYKTEQEDLLKAQEDDLSKVKQECRENVEKSLKMQYIAFKSSLQGYVAIITLALFGLSVFSVISQKTFCNDFLNFFKSIPRVTMAGITKIADLIPLESGFVVWTVLGVTVVLALILVYLLYVGANEAVGVWYLSVMAFLLASVVFFGAEIKPLIKEFNLFGGWMIAFVGSLTAIEVFEKVRDMRGGVIQDRTKNIIMFVGLAVFGVLLFVMVW